MIESYNADAAGRMCQDCKTPLRPNEYSPCDKCWKAKHPGGSVYLGAQGSYQACEHSPTLFMESARVKWFIGPARMVAEARPDLVINCTASSLRNHASYPEGYATLADHDTRSYKEVFLDWPDFAPPPFRVTFWRTLFDLAESDASVSRVYVCCTGGHGRSGTAASCLLVAACNMTGKAAIGFLRKLYCKLAVESATQEACVENLLTGGKKDGQSERSPGKSRSKGTGRSG